MARLTGFSKLLITLAILAAIFFGGKYILDNTALGESIKEQAQSERTSGSQSPARSSGKDPTLRVQLVTWGGYGPGLYFNEGFRPNNRSRFFKDYGFKVDFKVENDLITALNAWFAGEYDIMVQTADAFPLYTAPDDINAMKPRAFMQVDWSRGGDAIIVKRGINTVNDLKGKTIAVAVPSPAQTLLISSLEAAGLDYNEVRVVKTPDNLKAAELFRTNDIDAAVVWSPDDIIATRDVPGSKILLTTREQSHIIADIMFASQDFIDSNPEMIHGFYEGWMKGVAELKANKGNRDKAAKYLAEFNNLPVEDAEGMMDNVYFTGHGDNLNFFGLNPAFKGQTGAELYNKMARKFVETGDAEKVAPAWRSVIYTAGILAASNTLTGNSHAAEEGITFEPAAPEVAEAEAFATKPVSINFNTGQFSLSPNARTIIDLQFAGVAKSFANVRVRIEGNTDNVGGRAMNMDLSKKRAQSVADYLTEQYGMPKDRFIIVGNGPDKPIPGCESNANEQCRAQNRRTEFQLIAG
ncbi:MAG TPA: phosphate ABC transporter substrate-binding/OmpA family protein [Saprospiraceae bacterium]|nr:phosphate ABC transporter substrate-binding/OmpA family protein [Saprospiraceae bacterium]